MVVTVMFYFGIKNIISKDIQENIVFLSPKFVDTNYLLALFPKWKILSTVISGRVRSIPTLPPSGRCTQLE